MNGMTTYCKRALAVLLLAAIFCTCCLVPVAAARAVTTKLVVNGQDITSGGVAAGGTYTPATNTLTLNGAAITTAGTDKAGIFYEGDNVLTIELVGNGNSIDVSGTADSCGVKADGIRLTGSGSLTVKGQRNGILCADLMMDSGAVTVEQTYLVADDESVSTFGVLGAQVAKTDYAALRTASIAMSGGSLDMTAETGNGIACAGNMTVRDGNVTARGGKFGDGVNATGYLAVEGGELKGYAGGVRTFTWKTSFPMPHGAGVEAGSYIAVTNQGKLYGKTENKTYTRTETGTSPMSSANMAIATYTSSLFGGYVSRPYGGLLQPIALPGGAVYAGVYNPADAGQYVKEAEISGAVRFIPGTNSENQSWSGGAMAFRAYPELSQFSAGGQVKVDGQPVPASAYTETHGSTIITLTPQYLATLQGGAHSIEIEFAGHFAGKAQNAASTQFYIGGAGGGIAGGMSAEELNALEEAAAVPRTGDATPLLLLAGGFLLAGVVLVLRRRRRT